MIKGLQRWAWRRAVGLERRLYSLGDENPRWRHVDGAWRRRSPIWFPNTTRLLALLKALDQYGNVVKLQFRGMETYTSPFTEATMLEVAAKSRRARSVVYVRVTYAHEPEVEHLLAVSPVSGEVSLAGPHPLAPPEQAIPPLAEAVEMETEPYTRAMRKRGTPAVGDVDYRQDSINRHVEEVETKASKLGARYGALAGAALGLAGGLLSAWIAFKAGWTP